MRCHVKITYLSGPARAAATVMWTVVTSETVKHRGEVKVDPVEQAILIITELSFSCHTDSQPQFSVDVVRDAIYLTPHVPNVFSQTCCGT